MMPISPRPSSKVKRRPSRWRRVAGSSHQRAEAAQAGDSSSMGTTMSGVQSAVFLERHELDEADDDVFVAARTGRSARSASSLKPRSSTQLTLTGSEAGTFLAARTPASTRSKLRGTRVMRAKVSGSTASMLTVTRLRPASFSGWARDSSRWPLVVRAMSSGLAVCPRGLPSGA